MLVQEEVELDGQGGGCCGNPLAHTQSPCGDRWSPGSGCVRGRANGREGRNPKRIRHKAAAETDAAVGQTPLPDLTIQAGNAKLNIKIGHVFAMKNAALLMQRNEGLLLKAWADYHGGLFGHTNLFIFDNGSTDETTLQVLTEIEKKGVNVNRQHSTPNDFEKKGELIKEKISQLQEQGYSFLHPLDCDEFLGVMDDLNIITFTREALEDCLQSLLHQEGYFGVNGTFFNASGGISQFQFSATDKKVFFGASKIQFLDLGFHHGGVHGTDAPPIKTNIVHMHLHNRAYHIRKIMAAQKLRFRVKNFAPDNMKSYRDGAGAHLRTAFFQDESGMLNAGEINIPAFKEYMMIHNVSFPYHQYENTRNDLEGISLKFSLPSKEEGRPEIADAPLSLMVKAVEDCQFCFISSGRLSDYLVYSLGKEMSDKFFLIESKLSSDDLDHVRRVSTALLGREDVYINDLNCLGELLKPGAFQFTVLVHSILHDALQSVAKGKDSLMIVENDLSFLAAVVAALGGQAPSLYLAVPNFWSSPKYHFLSTFYSVIDTADDAVTMKLDRLESASFVSSSIDLKYLTPFVVNTLRDIAISGEINKKPISLNHRVDLMRLAHFGRPKGMVIKRKLSQWMRLLGGG